TREVLQKQISAVAKKEGYDLDAGAADLIALLGDGSFRDALGMLEKVISTSPDKKLSREEVEAITGAPRAGLVNAFIEGILAKNADAALKVLGEAEKAGLSINTLMTLILEKARFILLVQHSESALASVKERLSPDDFVFVTEQAGKKALTPSMLAVLLEAAEGMGRARIEALPLELAVVKICGVV
ncbi:MAG: polymerase subunit gamma and tau, polymerase subunit gamma/tau protein, partial [Candidatus Parcubacteria bacterium]|nr:polymerase subunit gamma and tau, polymerase subunit gamma/tau protein [Candidatus Parcubacteria bacterium]